CERAHVEPVEDRLDLAVELAIQDSAQLREIGDVLSRRKSRVDADLRGDDADPAADLLRRDLGVKAEDLDRPGVRREQRADDAQGGGLAGAVGTEQAEDLARVRLQGDAAQDLVRTERLFQAIDLDHPFGHFFLVVRLVAVDLGFWGVLPLVALVLAAGFAGARFGLGFSSAAASTLAASTSAGSSSAGSSSAGASAAAGSGATPIELDRVRWHVSHVRIVPTRAP